MMCEAKMISLEQLHQRLNDLESVTCDTKVWLDLTLDISDTGKWELDIPNDVMKWDAKCHKIFGTSPQIFIPRSSFFFSNIHPDDRERIEGLSRDAKTNGCPYDCAFRWVSPFDYSEHIIRTKGQVIFDQNHKPIRMIGVCSKLYERRLVKRLGEVETEVLPAKL